MASRFHMADEVPEVKVLPTGIPSLDIATRRGGLIMGTQNEIYGQTGTGKTTLACHVIAEAQRKGLRCSFIDVEGHFYGGLGERLVDISKLGYSVADPGTDAAKALEEAIDDKFDVVVFDSLGCLSNDKALEKGVEHSKVGGASKIITDMVNTLNPKIRANGTLVIYLNHIRDKIGTTMTGANEFTQVSPGGHAKEHMMTTIVYLRPGGFLEGLDGEKGHGQIITAKVIKNKGAPPRKRAQWNLWVEPNPITGIVGIDVVQDIVDVAVNLRVVEQTGAWYMHKSFPKKLQGTPAIVKFLTHNTDSFREIHNEILETIKEKYKTDLKEQDGPTL